LVGDKVMVVDGVEYVLEDYYPAVISRAEMDTLRVLLSKRGRQRGKGDVPALFTGMKIAFCGYCGSQIFAMDQFKERVGHDEPVLVRRLRCSCTRTSVTKCEAEINSCLADRVERAVLAFCGEQANLDQLVGSGKDAQPLLTKIESKRAELAAVEIVRLDYTNAISGYRKKHGKAAPSSLIELLGEAESDIQRLADQVEKLEREARVDSRAKNTTATQWKALTDKALALDVDARMRIRGMIAETFARIEIRMCGTGDGGKRSMFVTLRSQSAVERRLWIDRLTGDIIRIDDTDFVEKTTTTRVVGKRQRSL
jgi:hypothetical protein